MRDAKHLGASPRSTLRSFLLFASLCCSQPSLVYSAPNGLKGDHITLQKVDLETLRIIQDFDTLTDSELSNLPPKEFGPYQDLKLLQREVQRIYSSILDMGYLQKHEVELLNRQLDAIRVVVTKNGFGYALPNSSSLTPLIYVSVLEPLVAVKGYYPDYFTRALPSKSSR